MRWRNRDYEILGGDGQEFGFAINRILDEDGVVDLGEELEIGDVGAPKTEHSEVENVSNCGLWAMGNSFADRSLVVAAAEKPALAAEGG